MIPSVAKSFRFTAPYRKNSPPPDPCIFSVSEIVIIAQHDDPDQHILAFKNSIRFKPMSQISQAGILSIRNQSIFEMLLKWKNNIYFLNTVRENNKRSADA